MTEAALHAAFLPFGEVKEVSLPMDHATGTHRGFGFVEFEAPEDAAAAMDNMHNSGAVGVGWWWWRWWGWPLGGVLVGDERGGWLGGMIRMGCALAAPWWANAHVPGGAPPQRPGGCTPATYIPAAADAAAHPTPCAELYGRVLRVNYAQPSKIKGGDKGWASQAVWADADDWCARRRRCRRASSDANRAAAWGALPFICSHLCCPVSQPSCPVPLPPAPLLHPRTLASPPHTHTRMRPSPHHPTRSPLTTYRYEKHIAEEELDKLEAAATKAGKKAAMDGAVEAAAAGATAAAAAAAEAEG